MIVACPNCSARYKVGQDQLPAEHRFVRCTKCLYEWRQSGPTAEPQRAVAPTEDVLSCPECSTHFLVKTANVPASGCSVRCTKCRHIWFHKPQGGPRAMTASPGIIAGRADTPMATTAAPDSSNSVSWGMSAGPAAQTLPASHSSPSIRTAWSAKLKSMMVVARSRPPESDLAKIPSPRPFSSYRRATGLTTIVFGLLLVSWLALRYTNVSQIFSPSVISAHAPSSVAAPAPGIGLRGVSYDVQEAYGLGTMVTVHGTIVNSADKRLSLPKSVRIALTDINNTELYHASISPSVDDLGPHQSVAFETKIYNAPPATVHLEVRLDQSAGGSK